MATKSPRARLAPAQLAPEDGRPNPRVLERRMLVAFMQLLTSDRRPTPRHRWDDCGRRQPRMLLPFQREREMIHAAIQQGSTTPERVLEYHLARIADDLAQFPERIDPVEILYVKLAVDEAEALAAQSVDHALPSPEHHRAALSATQRVELDARLFCTRG